MNFMWRTPEFGCTNSGARHLESASFVITEVMAGKPTRVNPNMAESTLQGSYTPTVFDRDAPIPDEI